MSSKLVSLRVDEDLWQAVGDYAKARGSTKTAVTEVALRGLLKGGAPDLSVLVEELEDRRPVVAPANDFAEYARARQEKLNQAKYGGKR